MMPERRVHVLYPMRFWGGGPPETCYRICSHWPAQGLPVTVHAAACLRGDPARIMDPALPRVLPGALQRRLAGMPRLAPRLARRAAARALAAIRPGDICYAWPGAGIETIAEARSRGARILLEFINTHVAYAKAILDAECDRIGAPRYPQFTEATLAHEAARVRLADAVFAPGPFVERSIRETTDAAGLPAILPASYGTYLPSRPPERSPGAAKDRPLRFVFVGSVGLRKGVHVLIEAWRQARLPAELWLAGGFEAHLQAPEERARLLGVIPDTVRLLGHVRDIAEIYRGADVFVFPSLEEGGPQVTYEAAAQGLPLVVTPMGGGWIARDGETALVVPPADADALAEALTRLCDSEALRLSLGARALAEVPYFAWDRVADRRRQAALDCAMLAIDGPAPAHAAGQQAGAGGVGARG